MSYHTNSSGFYEQKELLCLIIDGCVLIRQYTPIFGYVYMLFIVRDAVSLQHFYRLMHKWILKCQICLKLLIEKVKIGPY